MAGARGLVRRMVPAALLGTIGMTIGTVCLAAPARGATPATITPSTGLHDLDLVHVSATVAPNLTVNINEYGGTSGQALGSATADPSGLVQADVYVHLVLPVRPGGGHGDCRTDSCYVMVVTGGNPVDDPIGFLSFAPGAQPVQPFTVTPHDDLQDGQVVHAALHAGAVSPSSASSELRTCDHEQHCGPATPVTQDPTTGAIDASYQVAATFVADDGTAIDCRSVQCEVTLFFSFDALDRPAVDITFAAPTSTTATTTTVTTVRSVVATPRFTG